MVSLVCVTKWRHDLHGAVEILLHAPRMFVGKALEIGSNQTLIEPANKMIPYTVSNVSNKIVRTRITPMPRGCGCLKAFPFTE